MPIHRVVILSKAFTQLRLSGLKTIIAAHRGFLLRPLLTLGQEGQMRFALSGILALVLFSPALSLANSSYFTSQGGPLTGSAAGLSLTGSTLVNINSSKGSGDLGTLAFSTGA